jgi:hypothetical protein
VPTGVAFAHNELPNIEKAVRVVEGVIGNIAGYQPAGSVFSICLKYTWWERFGWGRKDILTISVMACITALPSPRPWYWGSVAICPTIYISFASSGGMALMIAAASFSWYSFHLYTYYEEDLEKRFR